MEQPRRLDGPHALVAGGPSPRSPRAQQHRICLTLFGVSSNGSLWGAAAPPTPPPTSTPRPLGGPQAGGQNTIGSRNVPRKQLCSATGPAVTGGMSPPG